MQINLFLCLYLFIQINVARDIAVQMCDVFDQKDYVGVINVSYMSAATLPPMKPFMQLAETIGILQVKIL